jgi:hypothetical protein
LNLSTFSLADVQFIWNVWEVHGMILASLFLQVFLFLFAGMRRRCKFWPLQTALWLAYLSADSVAIFVIGHLAVRAGKSGHHLMYFWAPFVLVHLGGQDTITALSKQDNELWNRHLLILVTQAAMVGYVVSKASWPDSRLRTAVVIMLLSGLVKYAERTVCLFIASPGTLNFSSVTKRFRFLKRERRQQETRDTTAEMRETLDTIFEFDDDHPSVFDDILSVDPPLNRERSLKCADIRPAILKDCLSDANRHRAYEKVGVFLVIFYRVLYTKFPVRFSVILICRHVIRSLKAHIETSRFIGTIGLLTFTPFLLLFALFHILSTPIALVLFWASEKGDRLHTASRADITVSYILLVGAVILDESSAILFLLEFLSMIPGRCRSPILSFCGWFRSTILHVANKINLECCIKAWYYQRINQYNMIESRVVPPDMSRIKCCAMIAAFFEKPDSIYDIPKDGKPPIQNFILDSLLRSGAGKEWNIASSRGKLAIKEWISHQDPDSTWTIGKALEDCISFDFPISVLIWHIATDMCYYVGDKTSTDPEKSEEYNYKKISRELSNYIMYLICKCGVALTVNFHLVLDMTYDRISETLKNRPKKIKITDEEAVRNIFEAGKAVNEPEDSAVVEIRREVEEAAVNESEDSAVVIEIPIVEEPANERQEERATNNNNAGAESKILPRAYKLARELNSINDESERWKLIASVWAEMLFYIAPRCGASFHYDHLSIGGEFVTQVLLLMYFLGPFLPRTAAGAS